jgi:hypothetical protein
MVPMFAAANSGTYFWTRLDETFRHNTPNRFAHRGSAYAEFFAESDFRRERLAWLKFSA